MGFLDSLLNDKDEAPPKDNASGTPFKVVINLAPLRLSAMKDSMLRLIIKVTNISAEEQTVSTDVLLPRNALLGFEPTCINKHIEKKVGLVAAGETKEVVVPIYGTSQTKSGVYPFKVVVYAHYLDYTKVINQVEQKGELRVV